MKQDQIQKLGNTVLYLSKNVEDPTKTKILKLLYLLEEESIQRFHSPFFGFTFYAWQFGPVQKEVWENLDPIAISSKISILIEFIDLEKKGNAFYVIPKADFIDDEFSDNDISILEYISNRYRYADAQALVNITHKEGSLWMNTVLREEGLLQKFEQSERSTSDHILDFSEILTSESQKFIFSNEVDFLNFSNSLKK